ncbi:hypothetical protein KR200_007627, partial [Drosophila serrata]
AAAVTKTITTTNVCNQNKDAALLTLKTRTQGQSTKSGHAHEFRHGGDDDDDDEDGDDVAMRCFRQTKAYHTKRPAGFPRPTHIQPFPVSSSSEAQRKV